MTDPVSSASMGAQGVMAAGVTVGVSAMRVELVRELRDVMAELCAAGASRDDLIVAVGVFCDKVEAEAGISSRRCLSALFLNHQG